MALLIPRKRVNAVLLLYSRDVQSIVKLPFKTRLAIEVIHNG